MTKSYARFGPFLAAFVHLVKLLFSFEHLSPSSDAAVWF